MDRASKFVEIGVDRLLDCSTVKEVIKCKNYSCKVCVRKNIEMDCEYCYISQCATQLESLMKKGGEC